MDVILRAIQGASISILVFDYFETLIPEPSYYFQALEMGQILKGAMTFILILRTFALWEKNRTVLISLAILQGCICVISVLIISFYLGSWKGLIFILTVWIGVKKYRHSITPLVWVLYRDGVLYYISIIGISCGYILMTTIGPDNYHDLFFL
ncbi:hypothetical protein BDZ94DRAFT_1239511 [Collybia nuda]|uniref:Uncharacterized protein n=1 Tax=Collybia nuda TaxID=64659 RepID=A0A9P5Y0I4_9AGAR|nr:hypothetical protein BDZ94DRAFT_1239511 [Collybia nuda]